MMFWGSQPHTFSLLFAVFGLHLNYIKMGCTSGSLPHLPGGLQNRSPPLCLPKCHKNWSSNQVQKGNLLILCLYHAIKYFQDITCADLSALV